MKMMLHLKLKIDNVYDDGTVSKVVEVDVPAPGPSGEETLDDWAFDHLYPLTGTGRPHGDAGYFVEITEASDPSLVNAQFEWGT